MSDKDIDFPQYRKLSNEKVYYRILSNREFHEIQIIGKSAQLHKIDAKQYPEMLRIQDLLGLTDSGFLISNASEFEDLLIHYSL